MSLTGHNRECLICGAIHEQAPGYLGILPNGFLYGCFHAMAHRKPRKLLHCSKIRRVVSFLPEFLTKQEFEAFNMLDYEIFSKIETRATHEMAKNHLETVKMFDGKETSEDYRAQKQLVSRVMASYNAVAYAFLVRMKACKGVHYFQKKYHINKFENRVAVWIAHEFTRIQK